MVCDRCIMSVKQILDEQQLPWSCVELGRAKVNASPEQINYDVIDEKLKSIGFELIRDKSKILVESVKNLIVEHIHHNE